MPPKVEPNLLSVPDSHFEAEQGEMFAELCDRGHRKQPAPFARPCAEIQQGGLHEVAGPAFDQQASCTRLVVRHYSR